MVSDLVFILTVTLLTVGRSFMNLLYDIYYQFRKDKERKQKEYEQRIRDSIIEVEE